VKTFSQKVAPVLYMSAMVVVVFRFKILSAVRTSALLLCLSLSHSLDLSLSRSLSLSLSRSLSVSLSLSLSFSLSLSLSFLSLSLFLLSPTDLKEIYARDKYIAAAIIEWKDRLYVLTW
jgi:hypothetical protein